MREGDVKRFLLVGALTTITAALVLNVAGLARFPGGPLREWKDGGVLWLDMWPSDWGNNSGGNTPEADWAVPGTDLVYASDLSPNDWPWPVEVERITPVDASGNLVIAPPLLLRPGGPRASDLSGLGPLTADQQALIDADLAPLPGTIQPGGDGWQIALTFQGPHQGPAGWEMLAVDYRVGPFSFRVIHHSAVHLCLGTTAAERTCPGTAP